MMDMQLITHNNQLKSDFIFELHPNFSINNWKQLETFSEV